MEWTRLIIKAPSISLKREDSGRYRSADTEMDSILLSAEKQRTFPIVGRAHKFAAFAPVDCGRATKLRESLARALLYSRRAGLPELWYMMPLCASDYERRPADFSASENVTPDIAFR